jgi:phosphoribosylaminoimidazole-succinocarboxamide synthase
MSAPLHQSNVPGVPVKRGKVRDVYDLGDRLVIVASDRISAFDWVLPTAIPDKGKVLTGLTRFWLDYLRTPNHFLSMDPKDMGPEFAKQADVLAGRSMLVKKTQVVPFECVVRGYLAGSGWKEYRKSGTVCGQKLPAGLVECSLLPEPIFTPATKAESGHDENVSFEFMANGVGRDLAETLRQKSLDIYSRGRDYAKTKDILLADTKFEFGQLPDGSVILIDEVLTPDSSRFWPADQYRAGSNPPSFDKQFVRDWLEASGWDKNSAPPELPSDVVEKTGAKYREAFEKLTGQRFA